MGYVDTVLRSVFSNIGLVPSKPRLIARITNNYFNLLLLRRPVLRVVTVAIDYACQLSCPHCSADGLRSDGSTRTRLSLPDYSGIFKEAAACGAINIHFTGGEPLLYPDFYRIAGLVDINRNILSLVSNGLLLAKESKLLKRAGFDLVIVSIDSPFAEAHDKIRGHRGAHRKAWEGVKAARDAGLSVMIAMVATHENLNNGEIEEQIRICRNEKMVLQLLPLRPMGKSSGDRELLLDSRDQIKFAYLSGLPDVRWDGRSSYFPSRCLAARERLYIDPWGNVFPCDFIHKSFGNVKDMPLGSIWKIMIETPPYNNENLFCLSAFRENSL